MTTVERSFLSLDSSHYQGNGVYEYQFKPADFQDTTISLMSIVFYNSLFNIKAKYDNNTFSIKWIDDEVYSFTIPDGYYEFDDLNTYIEQQCLLNNLYLNKDNGTKNIFFFNLSTNPSRYRTQLDVYAVPTASEATDLTYSLPSGATWNYPATATTPQITFSGGLLKTMGMTSNSTFPVVASDEDETFLSDVNPRLLPVFVFHVTCNMVDNKLNRHPKLLHSIAIDEKYGSLINYKPQMMTLLPIRSGQYDRVRIELLDSDYNSLEINDPDFNCVLLLEKTIKK
jgi:hypothetical protein